MGLDGPMIKFIYGDDMKYKNLLDAVRKLNALQIKAEKSSDAYKATFDNNATPSRKATASDRAVSDCWERDKQLDIVHCELVNAGLVEPKPLAEYEPREIEQSAGHGHSVSLLYHPPKPNCLK